MRIAIGFLVIIFLSSFGPSSAWAKRFANQYTEFELPSGWVCALEGSEWVCQSNNKDRKKEAIIILAAKIRGSQDSLDQYQAYLKNTKTYNLPGGKTQVSEAKYAKAKPINGHQWIDALHLASEVPGFYTRYLATVKEDLGVAVTFSVSKDLYAVYKDVFDKIVESLRVFRQKNVNVADIQGIKAKGNDLLEDTTFIPDDEDRLDIGQRSGKGGGGSGDGSNTLILVLGLAGVVGFMIWKKRKR